MKKGTGSKALHIFSSVRFTHLKGSLSSQTLVHDGADAPQISFGIVLLRHDDLRSLCADKHSLKLRDGKLMEQLGGYKPLSRTKTIQRRRLESAD